MDGSTQCSLVPRPERGRLSRAWERGYTQWYGYAHSECVLCRSNPAGAAIAAECLLLLSKAPTWKSAVSLAISQSLEAKPEVYFVLVVASKFHTVSMW